MNLEKFKEYLEDGYENVQLVYQKINIITSELKDIGFEVFIVPSIKDENGWYWSESPGDFIDEYYGDKDWWRKKYIYIVFPLYKEGDVDISTPIYINYKDMTKVDKISVIDIFKKYLPNRFDWNGNNNNRIKIHYEERNISEINIDELNEEDTYPMLYIDAWYHEKGFIRDGIEHLVLIKKLEELFGNRIYQLIEYGNNDIYIKITKVNEDIYNIIKEELETLLESHKCTEARYIKDTKHMITENRISRYTLEYYKEESDYE